MPRISLDEARPGMVLARDVQDRSGRLLLGARAELNPRALKVFRMWGVTELDVVGPDPEPTPGAAEPPLDPEAIEVAQARAGSLFRHANQDHEVIAALMELSTLRMARQWTRARHGG
jgi:hypothetical protein